jgi:hypothetical protein
VGGIDSGLANAVTRGGAGGVGGIDSGLANAVTWGLAGGVGGIDSGLTNAVTWGLAGGVGGIDRGLASAYVATAASAATRTSPRILTELVPMIVHSLLEKQLRIQRVTQKGHRRYHKSNIAEFFFDALRLLVAPGDSCARKKPDICSMFSNFPPIYAFYSLGKLRLQRSDDRK